MDEYKWTFAVDEKVEVFDVVHKARGFELEAREILIDLRCVSVAAWITPCM